MTRSNPLRSQALKTIRFLQKEGLLTDGDALNVALIKCLCDEWELATSSTQRAALSKEIRNTLEALPKPQAPTTDDATAFMASLEDE